MQTKPTLIAIVMFCLTLLSSCTIYRQENVVGNYGNNEYQNLYIKTLRYEGVIFSERYVDLVSGPNAKFTPTVSDIELAEMLVRSEIRRINKERYNQGGSCPVIDKKLTKYKRQYFGYHNSSGDKIIFINCFWNKRGFYGFLDRLFHAEPLDERWKTAKYDVLDGCSYHWNIRVNLTSKVLFDLHVNGPA